MINSIIKSADKVMRGITIIFAISSISNSSIFCQDFNSIKSSTPVKITGSFNGAFNYTINNSSKIPPTGYNTGLNINFNFFNALNIPLNLAYSNYGSSFNTISINRFGISPSYKSLRVHAGHRSYVLSPYLMTGLTVLGGGIEFIPQKFNFLAFYGKISDPYSFNNEFPAFLNQQINHYDRNVYGVRLGFGKSSNRISISAFHAKDVLNSGTTDSLKKYNIRGKENFAIATDLTQTFFNNLTISGSGALSIVTNNIEGRAIEDENVADLINRASFLMNVNATSRHAFAYDAKISLRIRTVNIGLKYQHIDPYYNSMGVSFLQNNFDNYLFDINGSFLRGKLNLFSSFGLQYVNASGYTGLPQKRVVANLNTNINVSASLTLMGNYSNMVQNSLPKVEEVLDSLLITTNNSGWSGALYFKPGKGKQRPHIISLNTSSNTFDVIHNDVISYSTTNNNYSLDYKYSLKNKWSLGVGAIYNTGSGNTLQAVRRYGLTLNAGKSLTEGLNIKVNAAYRINETDTNKDGYVINGSAGISYQYKKAGRFSVNATQVSRRTTILSARNETRFRVNYHYSF